MKPDSNFGVLDLDLKTTSVSLLSATSGYRSRENSLLGGKYDLLTANDHEA